MTWLSGISPRARVPGGDLALGAKVYIEFRVFANWEPWSVTLWRVHVHTAIQLIDVRYSLDLIIL
jgi:hypothetical protein